jgi:hypothetical protein
MVTLGSDGPLWSMCEVGSAAVLLCDGAAERICAAAVVLGSMGGITSERDWAAAV